MEKMRQWTVLTALGVVGILAAGWFLAVSPQRSHASDLRTQAASQQQAVAQLDSQVAQLKEQQKGEPAQQRRLAQIANEIPDNPQLPALIRELSAAAHNAGVSLVSIAPAQPAPVTATATAAASVPLAQIPIAIQVTGSYFNIESFFSTARHMDRAMLVTGFSVNPGASGSSTNTTTGSTGGGSDAVSAAPNALTAQIQASVFESPSVAAPTATTAAQTPTTQTPTTSTSTAPAPQASAAPAAPAQ